VNGRIVELSFVYTQLSSYVNPSRHVAMTALPCKTKQKRQKQYQSRVNLDLDRTVQSLLLLKSLCLSLGAHNTFKRLVI